VVVNISSIAGLGPYAGAPVYVATKHAVIGLTRSFGVSTACNNVVIFSKIERPFFVVFFILCDAAVPEFYMPTFRDTLFVPSS